MTQNTFQLSLLGHLWRYHSSGLRICEIPERQGFTVGDVLSEFGIPEIQVMLVLVNGDRQALTYRPVSGDRVEVLPVIDGG